MGLEGSGDGNMMGRKLASRHKRSNSYPDKRTVENILDDSLNPSDHLKLDMRHFKDSVKANKKQSPNSEAHNSLKQEILHLEKKLQDEFDVRHALAKALGRSTSCFDATSEIHMPKPAMELIKEIAVLELEILYFEQYLLSLYRKAFNQHISFSSSPTKDNLSSPASTPTPKGRFMDIYGNATPSKAAVGTLVESRSNGEDMQLDSGIHRCRSALSQRSAFTTKTSSPTEFFAKAVRSCHSQPLSAVEWLPQSAENAASTISLAEHLGALISDRAAEEPNRLSEDMVKCMSAIYCKLADPPNDLTSPSSFSPSMSAFSSYCKSDTCSPGFRKDSSFGMPLENPFLVEGLKEFSGPYSTMIEVPWIYTDGKSLADIEHLLQNFRSMICKLEQVNLREMKDDQKLAFWINIHNALVMHAFLAYGISQNGVKRVFLLVKAAYNVGGLTISAGRIQSSILRCRMSRPGQWIRVLLSTKSNFKTGDDRLAYALERPEPLLHFALCSGSHSDPAVRVYTPKNVYQELESAKKEYIRATFRVRKEGKTLPHLGSSTGPLGSDLSTRFRVRTREGVLGVLLTWRNSGPEDNNLRHQKKKKTRENPFTEDCGVICKGLRSIPVSQNH